MGGNWKGDLVVMRIGKLDLMRPVDMRGKDAGRVNYAVKKYAANSQLIITHDNIC